MQPTLEDPARKSWKAILDSRYFGPAKGGEREGNLGCGEGNRFRVIRLHKPGNCGSRSHELRGANGSKNGVKRCQKRLLCPGNEHCEIKQFIDRNFYKCANSQTGRFITGVINVKKCWQQE